MGAATHTNMKGKSIFGLTTFNFSAQAELSGKL